MTGAAASTGRMAGKVAVVTGAARGQGRSHALRLAGEGADIVAVDVCADVPAVRGMYPGASEADLAETVAGVEALDRRVLPVIADVRDAQALHDCAAEARRTLGRLDVLVANAGIFAPGGRTHRVSEQAWVDTIDINLSGVWRSCAAVVPHLIEQGEGGSLILISSTAGIKGTPNAGAYAASKHGVVGLMRTLALELAPHSIRVNTVHPTGVATPMIHNRAAFRMFLPDVDDPTVEQAAAAFQSTNALPVPWVDPVDVSNAVLFLASEEARYVTGLEMKVDAGYTTR